MSESYEPTDEEISADVAALLAEVDIAMRSDRWAILNSRTEAVQHRLYDAAALRHCCQLLKDIDRSSKAGQEQVVRILGRTHLEAWIFGLYLHFGGYEALTKIAQDSYHHLKSAERAHKEFDEWLAREKKSARKRLEKVRNANAGIEIWNKRHPDLAPKPAIQEPRIPQLMPSGVDFSEWMGSFYGLEPRPLPVEQIVAALTELGRENNFSNESFTPIYLNYRMLSAGMIHPTLHLYDSYLTHGNFMRASAESTNGSLIRLIRITSLSATAFLAARVIGDSDLPAPVANRIVDYSANTPGEKADSKS